MPELHDELIVFDGLIIANWGPEVFADMRRGGITAANCTCSVWEGFEATMANLARFQAWFRAHADLILQIRTTEDIHCAKREGRTGIVLGFQNVSAFEDQLGAIGLFKELGVGIVQLAYNTQNLVGAGCYESKDPGLSDFGREVVAEMNRVGMLCDLSHVGPATSRDTILVSTQPVAYSHCLPAGLKAHPRNKSDEELRFIADHGGFVGVTMFPPLGLRRTFQTSQLFPGMTVLENMMAGLHLHTKAGLFASALRTGAMREEEAAAAEKAFEALRFVGMEGFADRPGNALSFGQQRVVEIARALISEPKVVLLDEPAVGLSLTRVAELDRLLRRIRDEKGVTLVMIEHVIRLVMDVCDRVVVLNSGMKIAEGTPDQVAGDPAVIEAYLGSRHAA